MYRVQPKNTLQPLPAFAHPNVSGSIQSDTVPSSTMVKIPARNASTSPNAPQHLPVSNASFSQNLLPKQESHLGLWVGGAIVILLIAFLVIKRKYFPIDE